MYVCMYVTNTYFMYINIYFMYCFSEGPRLKSTLLNGLPYCK